MIMAANAACAVSYGVPRAGVPAVVSFEKWIATAAARASNSGPCGCSIRVVGAVEGRTLNRTWRERDYATNVLSFPASATPVPPQAEASASWLGDIVLCAPVIAREARTQRKRTRDHYAHMTVHGLLHLLGFDHERATDARAMERLERRILGELGVPDPYG